MAASLGKKIKMLRTEKGLTQAELGELLNNTAVNSFVIFFLDFSDIIAYNDSKRMGVII